MSGTAPVGVAVTAVGFAATLSVLAWAIRRSIRRRSGSKAEGEVVEMSADSSGGFSPVVVFEPAPGEKVRISGNVVTNPPRYAVGDKVVVVFDAGDPQSAIIDRAFEHYFVPGLLGLFALAMLGTGLALWLG